MGPTRRKVLEKVATAGAAALGVAAGARAADEKPKANHEPAVPSKAKAEEHGPRELWAVVDAQGTLQRGMNVVAVKRLDLGRYEVVFNRDVRKGVYQATIGGHGFAGMPPTGHVSVQGRASTPRGVLVVTSDVQGDLADLGFHLLVHCPDGWA